MALSGRWSGRFRGAGAGALALVGGAALAQTTAVPAPATPDPSPFAPSSPVPEPMSNADQNLSAEGASGARADDSAVGRSAGRPGRGRDLLTTRGRTFTVTPRVELTETLTDNSRLSSSNRRGDLITQLSPGVSIASEGGRARGFLDYAATGVAYANGTGSNRVQSALSSLYTVEAIQDRAFVDLAGSISQQSTSAFGTQSTDSASADANRTEVRTFSVSPYLRGELGTAAQYEARISHTLTRASNDSTANNTTDAANLSIGEQMSAQPFNWTASGSYQSIDYAASRRVSDERLRGLVSYRALPELRLSLIGGVERNDYLSTDKQTRRTPGWGVEWRPTERTRLSATRELRFFGDSHALVLEHRTPRTAISYSDTKDISNGLNQPRPGSQGTAYDFLYSKFGSGQTDPELIAKQVNDYLQANNISRDARLLNASPASAPTVQRLQQLALAWFGLRDTLTLTLSRGDASRVDSATTVLDDFANGNHVRTSSATLDLAHRLTALSTLNLDLTVARASGDLASQSSRLRTVLLRWSTRLDPRITASFALRRSVFDSPTQPYTASDMLASLRWQF